jgi:LysM repeat protein
MHEQDTNPTDNFVMSGKHATGEEREETYGFASGESASAKRSLKPVLIAAAGLLIAVIFVLMFLSGSPKSSEKEQVKSHEARLRSIEEKLAKLEWLDTGLARLDRKEKEIASLSERMLQLESALNLKVDQLSKQMAKPQATKQPEPSPSKAESAPSKAEPPAQKAVASPAPTGKDTKTKVHVVQKGETLYGISRKYGITVDELLKLNKISSKDPIKPGQQLVVGSAKSG